MRQFWVAAGLAGLITTGCGGTQQDEAAKAPDEIADAQSCADDGARLPLTGLCAGRAINYLDMDASASPEAPEGCEWQVMETQMIDDVLLYRGLKCEGGEATKLEYAGGAHRAELQLVNSAFLGKIDEPPTYVHVYTIEGDPIKGVTQRAREGMENAAEAAGCTARKANAEGWPSDALVVDVSPDQAAKAPADEPRTACGPLGLNEDESSFWRVTQGYGWFFELGQDATEIDPGSLTLMAKGSDGSWGAI